MSIEVHLLKPRELTESDRAVWHRLQQAETALAHPCLAWDWADLAAEAGEPIEIALLEQAGALCGFWAYHRRNNRVALPVAPLLSDQQAWITAADCRPDPPAILQAAGLRAWRFDHLVASQSFLRPFHARLDDSFRIDLSDGFEAYRAARRAAGSGLAQVERKARKLQREIGPLRFEWHSDDAEIFARLCEWKQRDLRQRGFRDVFELPGYRDLLEGVRQCRREAWRGVLSALYAGDRPVAAQLNMLGGGVLNAWIPAYDAEFSRYSPGAVLQLELARAAAERGAARIDLGRGANQTKRQLASGTLPLALGTIERRPLHRMLHRGWYTARDLVDRLPLGGLPRKVYRRLKKM